MFDGDEKSYGKMAPLLKRVLIADPQVASARMLSNIMRDVARSHCWHATTTARALKIAETSDPQLIVVEIGPDQVDGLEFAKTLRRSTWSSRKAPIITITGVATAASILAARDAGVHEFLLKPYSLKDLVRRLGAVTLKERDWVEAMDYIGPDRRRFNSGEYGGKLKRRNDGSETPLQQKINQALKIIRAAVAASDTDPEQAMRAMLTQATTIQGLATDFRMTLAASEFHRHLFKSARAGQGFTRAEAADWAAPMLVFMTKDADARPAKAA